MTTPSFSDNPCRLTYELEDYGGQCSTDESVEHIVPHLRSKEDYVREGALIGLYRHLSDPRVQEAVRNALETETNITLRELMREALEESQ